MSPPIHSNSNVAAASAPISKEEMALLADEQCIQQEMDDLEHLLAAKLLCAVSGFVWTQDAGSESEFQSLG